MLQIHFDNLKTCILDIRSMKLWICKITFMLFMFGARQKRVTAHT